jgi:lipid-A-disaccharide synthase-like uncharacterized protein
MICGKIPSLKQSVSVNIELISGCTISNFTHTILIHQTFSLQANQENELSALFKYTSLLISSVGLNFIHQTFSPQANQDAVKILSFPVVCNLTQFSHNPPNVIHPTFSLQANHVNA